MAGETGELEAEIAGQKLSLKNVSLNTIATVATLVVVCVLAWVMWQHTADAREAQSSFVAAIKEQTSAIKEQTAVAREQNCLISMPQASRDPDLCRRLSR